MTGPHGGAYANFPSAPVNFQAGSSADAVNRLFVAAVTHAQSRLDTYDARSDLVSPGARRNRSWSIFFFALGTAMPILVAMLIKLPPGLLAAIGISSDALRQAPFTELGYILLAVAGTLVVYDQFFDQTGSWIRYRQAQARLEVQLADLRFAWATLMADCGGVIADGKQAAKFVQLLRDFVVRIELTAEAETREWAAQFKARIEAFDRNPNLKVQLPGEAAPPGQTTGGGQQDGASGASGDGSAPPTATEPATSTVRVRLAIAEADKIQALALKVDAATVEVPPEGLVEVSLAVGSPHMLVATGMRDGKQVAGELPLTPTIDDEGKPLQLTLTPVS